MFKIKSYPELNSAQRRSIIFRCLKWNESVEKAADYLNLAPKIVKDYLSFLLHNKMEQDKYLPPELYDKNRNKFRQNIQRGYYTHLSGVNEEMTIGDIPVYSETEVSREGYFPFTDRLSFSERLEIVRG